MTSKTDRTNLDKFKRRLVRSVSQLLKQDEETQANTWRQMQKESGCDCKLLWERMRALTIKKLKRLLAANDCVDNIAAVARLTVTDWLLFDLVLVHEDIDVIGRDQIVRGSVERRVLDDLFDLVIELGIEKLGEEHLAEGWSALTKEYNSRFRRQCSPMLLQRRWYQLKELTRGSFYRLWNNYRGNAKLWDLTSSKPTTLQSAIAKVFPQVITMPFPEWDQLIRQGKVILLEQFEMLHRKRMMPKAVDDKPDLVVIEPEIETIELGDESDGEDRQSRPPRVDLALVKQEPIEEEQDGLSNVKILATTHIPSEDDHFDSQHGLDSNLDITNDHELIAEVNDITQQVDMDSELHDEQEIVDEEDHTNPQGDIDDLEEVNINPQSDKDDLEEVNINPQGDIDDLEEVNINPQSDKDDLDEVNINPQGDIDDLEEVNVNPQGDKASNLNISDKSEEVNIDPRRVIDSNLDIPKIPEVIQKASQKEITTKSNLNTEELIQDDLIKQKVDEYLKAKIVKDHKIKVEIKETSPESDNTDNVVDDIIKQKADDFVKKVDIKKLVHDVVDEFELPSALAFADDGIEFVDDGIECIEYDDEASSSKKIKVEPSDPVIKTEGKEKIVEEQQILKKAGGEPAVKEKGKNSKEVPPKFDLKLLMEPVVYTTKLDDMIIFKGKKFDFVQLQHVIDSVVVESKPVSKQTIKVEVEDDTVSQSNLSQSDKSSDDELLIKKVCQVRKVGHVNVNKAAMMSHIETLKKSLNASDDDAPRTIFSDEDLLKSKDAKIKKAGPVSVNKAAMMSHVETLKKSLIGSDENPSRNESKTHSSDKGLLINNDCQINKVSHVNVNKAAMMSHIETLKKSLNVSDNDASKNESKTHSSDKGLLINNDCQINKVSHVNVNKAAMMSHIETLKKSLNVSDNDASKNESKTHSSDKGLLINNDCQINKVSHVNVNKAAMMSHIETLKKSLNVSDNDASKNEFRTHSSDEDLLINNDCQINKVDHVNVNKPAIMSHIETLKKSLNASDDDASRNESRTHSSDKGLLINKDCQINKDGHVNVNQAAIASHVETLKKSLIVSDEDVSRNASRINSSDEDDDDDDEGESDENTEIDESLKVKPTSYLLQKPRNRSYNPIQLCKNPDFNTRLKRLTAGFFSSERNRRLLSACKPMTVDFHKAFEQKLINGTLYLKSSGTVPQPVEKEERAHSSSVVPSAMPIQSLLSKDSKLKLSDLIPSTSQIDTVDLTKRSKTINLRDLSEIRRINQNLLTAQVPPMRVSKSQIEMIAAIEAERNRSTDSRQNLPLGRPLPESAETQTLRRTSTDINKSNQIDSAGKQELPVDNSSTECIQDTSRSSGNAYRGAQRGRGRGGRGGGGGGRGGGGGSGGDKVKKPPIHPPYKPIQPSHVSWFKGRPAPTVNLDDFLITIDTLNRMINKLDGQDEFKNPKAKNRKPLWSIDERARKSQPASDESSNASNKEPGSMDTDEVIVEDVAMNVTVGDKSGEKPAPKRRTSDGRYKYCCWAREKERKLGTKMRVNRRHACGPNATVSAVCNCCCRLELAEAIKQRTLVKQRSVCCQTGASSEDTIVLSDGEVETTDNDSNDARIPGFDPELEPPTPKIRVYTPPQGSRNTSRGLPLSVAGVSATQSFSAPVASTSVSTRQSIATQFSAAQCNATQSSAVQSSPTMCATVPDPKPVLKINVNFMTDPSTGAAVLVAPTQQIQDEPVVDTAPKTLLQQIALQLAPPAPAVPLAPASIPPPEPVTKLNLVTNSATIPVTYSRKKHKACRKPSLIIDGSGQDTKISTEKENDRVMFLNSKSIADKPKESPIYLGKNKILLTTVKFPPNLDGKKEVPPAPTVVPTLPLPAGVQLILLPSGDVTYTVDPSVQLDEAQMASLPNILSAVQEQININSKNVVKSAASSIIEPSTSVNNEQTTGPVSTESPHVTGDIPLAVTDSTNELNSSKDSDIITIEDDVNSTENADSSQNNVNTTNNADASGSRNLLSDLMEMSGISAEDEKLPESAETVTQTQADSLITTEPKDLESIPKTQLEMTNPTNVKSTPEILPASSNTNLAELSPITSLAELKYACDHKGLFYKLDLDTGIIACINVCIKKNTGALKKVTRIKRNCASILPKSAVLGRKVIDLTEEEEPKTPSNILEDGTVKPIKLIKRVVYHPNLIRKRPLSTTVEIPMLDNAKSVLKRKRKQRLEKIEAKIDLVDSDEPMEEEYLVDSSDSDNETLSQVTSKKTQEQAVKAAVDSGDSSDEEPLSKKFMRLKQIKETVQEPFGKVGGNENIDDSKGKQLPQESEDIVADTTSLSLPAHQPEDEKQAQSISTISEDMEIEEPQFQSFLAEDTEPQDEDCILGV